MNYTFFEFISLAKLFSRTIGGNNNMTISDAELEAAAELLKKLGDDRRGWSTQDKETYKAMVDFAKETSKSDWHG